MRNNTRRTRSLVVLLTVAVGVAILGAALLGLTPFHRDSSVTVAAVGAESWPPPDDTVAPPPSTTTTTAPPTTTTAAALPPVTTAAPRPKPATTTTVKPAPRPGDVARGLAPNAFLQCVARYESGSNYASPGGGMYGIIDSTWRNATLGYSARYGVAHSWLASPSQQDAAALDLFQRYGTKPWSTRAKCGG